MSIRYCHECGNVIDFTKGNEYVMISHPGEYLCGECGDKIYKEVDKAEKEVSEEHIDTVEVLSIRLNNMINYSKQLEDKINTYKTKWQFLNDYLYVNHRIELPDINDEYIQKG
jgi:DNA-directed RNA polymerase subunit M/transcription elongation factor TFIIS